MKVFVTREIPAVGVKMMQDAGIVVKQWHEKRELTQKELIAYCMDHDALLSAGRLKLDKIFMHKCSHLKVISLYSVGFDSVDVDTATKLSIPVGNTPGVLSGATADTAFLLMLATSRKAFFHHRRVINGDWDFYDPTANLGIELNGKTLGIFGLGKIGFEMAKKSIGAYGMNVIYCNRSENKEAEKKLKAMRVSFDELLKRSDVISVHSALTDETKGVFNKDAFYKMKPGSMFINTARGAIHNEKDLTAALKKGVIWGAGLDVTNPEPMQPENPLLKMPNVCVLPHIGSATEETRNAMAKMAAENVIAGLRGKKLPHVVNGDVYDKK